jgi:hypothetical protein
MSTGGFFDKFGAKERTGLGGRSKVLSPEPTASSPVRYDMPPAGYNSGFRHAQHTGQRSMDADTRLLMGIGSEPASTFRTSEVLRGARGPPGAGAARWLDFNSTGGDDTDTNVNTFFEDVERMRIAKHTSSSSANIYGTPFHVTQAREEELRRRRPSFGEELLDEQPPITSSYHAPYQATAYVSPPPRALQGLHLTPIMEYAASPLPGAPTTTTFDVPSYASPPAQRVQRKPPHALDPIGLPREKKWTSNAKTKAIPQDCHQHGGVASPVTHRASPPLTSKLPPPHRKDVANLPGAVYSRAIPQLVHGILYGC